MNRGLCRTEVRDILGEDAADFWTDAELNRHLNEGQRRFNGEATWPWLVSEGHSDLPTSIDEFELPNGVDFSKAINLSLTVSGQTTGMYQPVRVSPSKGFQLRRMYSTTTTAARPNWFYVTSVADGSGESLYTTVLKFIPAPTATMLVEYQYYRVVSDLTADTENPDTPVEYHKAVVHFAAGTAWLKELNGGSKAKEQFELYNVVVEQAKREFFTAPNDQPLVLGKDEPQYVRGGFVGDGSWDTRLPETLGP